MRRSGGQLAGWNRSRPGPSAFSAISSAPEVARELQRPGQEGIQRALRDRALSYDKVLFICHKALRPVQAEAPAPFIPSSTAARSIKPSIEVMTGALSAPPRFSARYLRRKCAGLLPGKITRLSAKEPAESRSSPAFSTRFSFGPITLIFKTYSLYPPALFLIFPLFSFQNAFFPTSGSTFCIFYRYRTGRARCGPSWARPVLQLRAIPEASGVRAPAPLPGRQPPWFYPTA